MVYWTRYYRLASHTRQLRFDNPDGFFRGQPPRHRDNAMGFLQRIKKPNARGERTAKTPAFWPSAPLAC